MKEPLQIVRFNIDASLNPWSQQGEAQLDELLFFIDQMRSQKFDQQTFLLLTQKNDSYHLNPDFAGELSSSCWYQQLLCRLLKMRMIISSIASLPIASVYLTSKNCFSFYYELALAARFWCVGKGNIEVGFPEMLYGLFPSSGSMELKYKNLWQVFEEFEKKPVGCLTSSRSHTNQPDLLLFLSSSERLLDIIVDNFSSKKWESRAPSLEQKMAMQRKYTFLSQCLDSDNFDFLNIDFRQLEDIRSGVRDRVRKKGASTDFDVWLMQVTAHRMLSNEFIKNLSSCQISSQSIGMSKFEVDVMVLNIQRGIPPIDFFKSLLDLDILLIFYAESSLLLQRALEILYVDCKSLPATYREKWNQLVTWYSGREKKCFMSRCLFLSFEGHNNWLAQYGNKKGQVHLLGKTSSVEDSDYIFEVPNAGITWLSDFCRMLGYRVISTEISDSGFGKYPLHMIIRLLGIDVIIRLAGHHNLNLNMVVAALQHEGWWFLGSEFDLDYFLSNLPVYFVQDIKRIFGEEKLREIDDSVLSWKILNQRSEAGVNESISAQKQEEISSNCALNLIDELRYLKKYTHWLTEEELDTMFAKALGLPSHLGSFAIFCQLRGKFRVQWEIDRSDTPF